MPLKLGYGDENDGDFIRWTSNLLRRFYQEGRITLVTKAERPDLIMVSIWDEQELPPGIPAMLVSNENWSLYKSQADPSRYKAVVGIYPPPQPCNFIAYPYAAVHMDMPVEQLYAAREEMLRLPKSRFCCFVVSNATIGELAPWRMSLFEEINSWRPVASGGGFANNIGMFAPRGRAFLSWIAQFKYMICPENSAAPGYITEKPWQPWFAGTVPIYHGGAINTLNPAAIVAAMGDVREELNRLEADDAAYQAKRHAPLQLAPLSLAAFEAQVLDAF